MKKTDNIIKMKPSGYNLKGRTALIMALFGILAFISLAAGLYYVMIVKHDAYQSGAVEQQVSDTTITASRGTIYDAKMRPLAMSAEVSTIYISPAELIKNKEEDKKEMITSRLSEILGVSYDTIYAKWSHTDSWYETIAIKVEAEVSDEVRALKKEYGLTSVHILADSKRYYPGGNLASQIIGFVGYENTGLEGIEAVYDSYLAGVNGRIVKLTSEKGVEMMDSSYESYYAATDGSSLVLTIDSTIQHYLEKNLAQAIDDCDIRNGAMGIVMDVNTGAVLAMSALPNYDLNDYLAVNEDTLARLEEKELSEDEYEQEVYKALLKQWRNRIISDTYEPGSTFKIITLAMGLEEGVISENDTFFCEGCVTVKGRTTPLYCWKREGHGEQDLAASAQHSCNVAFVNIGLKMGAAKFYDYIEAFGLFDKTGIDLYGESSSIWWAEDIFEDPSNYSQLAAASFGQTFNITPIQLITAVSAVANGGYLMKPYIVSKVLDNEGNVIENREPVTVRQVISENTSRRVSSILESVVSGKEGTGKNAYVAGYRIAGKTGTSEDVTGEVVTGEKQYKVSFIGYAPADDPKVAVLVILDTPSKSSGIYISGGGMAAPVVGKIMNDVLPYLGVEQVFSAAESSNASDVKMLNVKTLMVTEAQTKLEEAGLNVRIVGEGSIVTDQAPMANVTLAMGSTVILYAGEAKPEDTVEVPELKGMSYRQAKAQLESAGLFIRTMGAAPSDSSKIIVASQGTSGHSEVAYGSVIQVTLIDTDSSVAGEGAG